MSDFAGGRALSRVLDAGTSVRQAIDTIRSFPRFPQTWYELSDAGVGNTAATQTTLFSTTIPAKTLIADGDAIEFRSSGLFANTASTDKRLLFYFGSTLLYDTTNSSIGTLVSSAWTVDGLIVRNTVSTYRYMIDISVSDTTFAFAGYGQTGGGSSENFNSANTLSVNGNGTLANDVTANIWYVRFLPIN